MSKTKIEWCDYTINPVKGLCPMACSYCYARRMYKRFKWDPEIRMEYSLADDIKGIRKPSRIFIGSTMELFGEWIKPQWMLDIFESVKMFPQHTYIFLTKKPENLIKWQFPENCWVGVSATNQEQYVKAFWGLNNIEARVKFISFEPLLGEIKLTPMFAKSVYNWIIIGQQTPISAKTMPTVKSITEIMTAADKVEIPIFLKDNLKGFLPFRQHYGEDYHGKCYKLRQEFPNGDLV